MKFIIFLLLPIFGNSQLQTNSSSQALKYEWRKISGPSQYKIESPMANVTAVTNLVEGVYQFELKVTNSLGLSGRDTMVLTVRQPDNKVFIKPVNKALLSSN